MIYNINTILTAMARKIGFTDEDCQVGIYSKMSRYNMFTTDMEYEDGTPITFPLKDMDITNKKDYTVIISSKEQHLLTSLPQHVITMAKFVEECILIEQFDKSNNPDLWLINPLCDSSESYITIGQQDIESAFKYYYPHKELDDIIDNLYKILDMLILEPDIYHRVSLDSIFLEVTPICSIKEMRFDEVFRRLENGNNNDIKMINESIEKTLNLINNKKNTNEELMSNRC